LQIYDNNFFLKNIFKMLGLFNKIASAKNKSFVLTFMPQLILLLKLSSSKKQVLLIKTSLE
jgi:hypothetical protein